MTAPSLPPAPWRALFWLCCVGAALAAFAHLARAARSLPPAVQTQPFRLADKERDFQTVAVERPLLLPHVYGDCDLLATVSLPAQGELDVVFRKVDLADGHGRFALLRLSTKADGPPWRTREQALFGDADLAPGAGGIRVAPGLPVSIRLELRGQQALANVGGRWLGELATVDDRGSFALVVRGGLAEVSHLQIEPLPAPPPAVWPWLVALGLGVLLGLGGGRARARARGWLGLAFLLLASWWLAGVLSRELLVGLRCGPRGGLLLLAAACGVTLALVRLGGLGPTLVRLAAAGLAMFGLGEACCRLEGARLAARTDPRLDLYFGADARTAPFDALAKQLSGKNEVHLAERALVEPELRRIVFLGGEPMFEANLDRAQHLAIQATARAGHELRRKLVAAVVPTLYPHTLQQTALFQRFYADAYPARLVVLGIDRWEAQHEGRASARARLAAASAPRAPASVLWDLLRVRLAAPAMIAPPVELQQTISEFAAFCAERKLPLLLATHALLPAAHLVAVETAARAHGLRVVRDAMRADESADVDALARAIVDSLR
jgi:hypothetical protein